MSKHSSSSDICHNKFSSKFRNIKEIFPPLMMQYFPRCFILLKRGHSFMCSIENDGAPSAVC